MGKASRKKRQQRREVAQTAQNTTLLSLWYQYVGKANATALTHRRSQLGQAAVQALFLNIRANNIAAEKSRHDTINHQLTNPIDQHLLELFFGPAYLHIYWEKIVRAELRGDFQHLLTPRWTASLGWDAVLKLSKVSPIIRSIFDSFMGHNITEKTAVIPMAWDCRETLPFYLTSIMLANPAQNFYTDIMKQITLYTPSLRISSPFGLPTHVQHEVDEWVDPTPGTMENKLASMFSFKPPPGNIAWRLEDKAFQILKTAKEIQKHYGDLTKRYHEQHCGPANGPLAQAECIAALVQLSINVLTELAVIQENPANITKERFAGLFLSASIYDGMLNATIEAQHYWLPPAMVQAIMTGEELDTQDKQQIRLPFSSVMVTFGAPLRIDNDPAYWDDPIFTMSPPPSGQSPGETTTPEQDKYIGRALHNNCSSFDVVAVILQANPKGSLKDQIIWIINPALITDKTPPPLRLYAIPGSIQRCGLQNEIYAVAAMVAWGPWQEAQPAHPIAGQRNAPHYLNAEDRPAPPTFVYLRVPQENHPSIQVDQNEPAYTMRTHMRRAHWRRQRVGPRSDWAYKRVWIRPSIINPGGVEIPGAVVNVVPKKST